MRRRQSHRSASAVSAAVESLEPRTLLSFAAHVDFQPSTVAVYRGYVMDSGATYGSRGNGLTYGWNAPDNSTRARGSPLSPDERYDTFNQMQVKGAGTTWEMAVPNGKYQVHIVSGDAQFIDSVYKINAEGVLAVNSTPTKSSHWVQGTATVTVSDGRLTVSNATGAVNNKIDFIDILASPPPAPTALKAAASSNNQVNLSWSANPTNIDGFTVQRSVNAINFTTIATLAGTATGYADTGLNDGTTYYYRVTAFNSTGSSPVASAQATTPLAAPSGLTAVATQAASIDPVTLTWTDHSAGATGYEVDRSTDGVNFTAIATVGPTATTCTDNNVLDGTAYTYSVRATGAVGTSPAAVVQTTTPVSPPNALTARPVNGNEIDLNWTNTSATATQARVERSTDGAHFGLVATLPPAASTFADIGLNSAMAYTYRIDAANATGISTYAVATATTAIAAPTNVRATPNQNTSWVNLSWTGSPAADGYLIERSSDGVTFTSLATVAGSATTSYTDTTAAAATTYSYRISAQSAAAGQSAPSQSVTASTTGFLAWRNWWPEFNPGEPAPATYGFSQNATTGVGFWTAPHVPSESLTRATADHVAAEGAKVLVIDVEDMPNDVRKAGAAAVQNTVTVLSSLLDWIKSEQPALKVTLYDPLVLAPPPAGSSSADVQAWQNAQAALDPLMQRVDCLVPCLYTLSASLGAQSPNDWQRDAIATIQAERVYGKPIYPYLMSVYLNLSDPSAISVPLDDAYWRLELQTMRRYADGFVIWGPGDGPMTLWAPTLEFAAAQQPAGPADPASNLTASAAPGQVTLTWTASGVNTTGFTIQRSEDGANFSSIAVVGPTGRTYTDTRVLGRTYSYRVLAGDWLNDAAPSNTVSVPALRVPTATHLASGYEAVAGPNTANWTAVGVAGGTWLKFGNEDFSSPANTLIASVSVPGPGVPGQMVLHLDSPTGAAIGALGLASTGGWGNYMTESASVSGVSGVHDLYLAFTGNPYGVANLSWFRFANTAVPAAPTGLTASLPAPSQVAISWTDTSGGIAGFKVERSTDGVNFSEVALIPPGTTTYTDTNPSGAGLFYYQVMANTPAGGDSAASNTVTGAPSRDGHAVIQAEAFDATSGSVNSSSALISASNGGWLQYNNVDFGSGVSTFTASLATARPTGTGSIEIHIDGPNGPLLGTLIISGTGGWLAFVPQTTAITPVAGRHNVYLVFQGYGGNMDWFQFA